MYSRLVKEINAAGARLVAVSKTKPVLEIQKIYDKGQRIFGENKVQELVSKKEQLPSDIQWHIIGQLQRNKVKFIAPFVALIHSVDSLALAKQINKEALKNERIIDILLQIKIANEATKQGWDVAQLKENIGELKSLDNIRICGVMGMGTFTSDEEMTAMEFKSLKEIFNNLQVEYFENITSFRELSMGMSGDYKIALAHGSTMVRIGSLLFGNRI